jgi:catechol 2,3-dioxygenase-like lactoylglutathione lyase family enzyme
VQIRRLSWVGTRTQEFASTKQFFGGVLGLPLITEEPGFAMFQLPGGLHDYVEVFAVEYPDVEFMTTGPVPGFIVDDVVQARTELEAAGLEMLEPIQWMADVDAPLVDAQPDLAGYGWFQFRGPDGNVYCCTQDQPAR